MKAVVTGGAGFIGSHLVDRLISDGHTVYVVDDFSTGKESNLNDDANIFRCDIANFELHKITFGWEDVWKDADTIFHLAAKARIQPSFKNPIGTFDVNTKATLDICELARKYNSKIIYSGSSSFYADPHLNPYALSKYHGEGLCRMYNKVYDVPVSVARFFNVYGDRHLRTGPFSTVVGIFEEQYLSRNPLTITGDGTQRRDFTHIEDIVDGLILMSESKCDGSIFNLGTGRNYSINELAKMYDCEYEYIPRPPGEAKNTLADIDSSRKILGYNPKGSLEEYVSSWLFRVKSG